MIASAHQALAQASERLIFHARSLLVCALVQLVLRCNLLTSSCPFLHANANATSLLLIEADMRARTMSSTATLYDPMYHRSEKLHSSSACTLFVLMRDELFFFLLAYPSACERAQYHLKGTVVDNNSPSFRCGRNSFRTDFLRRKFLFAPLGSTLRRLLSARLEGTIE